LGPAATLSPSSITRCALNSREALPHATPAPLSVPPLQPVSLVLPLRISRPSLVAPDVRHHSLGWFHAPRSAFMRAQLRSLLRALSASASPLQSTRLSPRSHNGFRQNLRGVSQESSITRPVAIDGRNWGSDHGVSARAPTGTVAISFPVRGWGSPSRHQENHISQLPFSL
jgi:hypothetical protein